MADGKKSFLLYADLIHTVRKLPKETRADLFLHILEYVNDLNPVIENDILLEISFEPIKQQLKRDLKDWEQTIHGKSEGGKKSAAIRKKLKEMQDDVSMLKLVKDTPTNSTDSVNVTVSVNDTVTVSDTVKKKEITKVESFPIIPKTEKKTENMVVIEMIKIFRQKKKSYIVDENVDYPACLEIAYKIAKLKGWKKMDVVGDKEDDVLLSWKKIVDFIVSDKWFTTRTLSDIAGKEWNRIEPSMKSLKNGTPKKDVGGGYDTGVKDQTIYDKMK